MKKFVIPLFLVSLFSLSGCSTANGLDTATTKMLKEAYYLRYVSEDLDTEAASEIEIMQYYGQYNDYYVLLFNPINSLPVVAKETINESVFTYSGSNQILVYKDNFLTLKEAYLQWFVTGDDVKKIHQIHTDNYEEQDDQSALEIGEEIVLEEKIIWDGDINDDFADDLILITIDNNFNDTAFSVKDFRSDNISEVVFLTENSDTDIDDFHHIYFLKLKQQSKTNVIDTLREIEKLDFVLSAEPNYSDGQLH